MEGENSFGGRLFMNMSNIGDVTFVVGPEGEAERIKSSVFVLRTFSTVFDTQFNETWKSQQEIVELPDIQPKIFRLFLKLLCTDKVSETHLVSEYNAFSMEEILHLLYIAKKYDVNSIQSICRISIKSRLEIQNAVLSYETLQNMNEPELERESFNFIIAHFDQLLEEDSFVDLSVQSLTTILKSEELSVREVTIFKELCRWAEAACTMKERDASGKNMRKELGNLLYLIRFPVMTIQELYETVKPTGILSSEEIVLFSEYLVQKSSSPNEPLPTVNLFVSLFSRVGRPNVTNEAPFYVKPSILDHCFVYTPSQSTVVSVVKFSPSCCQTRTINCNYTLKMCIFQGDREILPVTTENILANRGLSLALKKGITFSPNKSYRIYYEIKRNESAPVDFVSVDGATLHFKSVPHLC